MGLLPRKASSTSSNVHGRDGKFELYAME